jgi:hypothetical protein
MVWRSGGAQAAAREAANEQWLEMLRQRGETARELATELPSILSRENISLQDATAMSQLLGRFGQVMKSMVEEMELDGAEEHLVELGGTIATVFDDLAQAAGERTMEIQQSFVRLMA